MTKEELEALGITRLKNTSGYHINSIGEVYSYIPYNNIEDIFTSIWNDGKLHEIAEGKRIKADEIKNALNLGHNLKF